MFHVVHTFSKWPVWSNHRSYYCETAHEQLLNYLAWVMNNSCMVKLGRRTYNCWQWLVRGNRRRTKATFHSWETNFNSFGKCTLENMIRFHMSWQFLIQEGILGEMKTMKHNLLYGTHIKGSATLVCSKQKYVQLVLPDPKEKPKLWAIQSHHIQIWTSPIQGMIQGMIRNG